jgi:hypothetical protein
VTSSKNSPEARKEGGPRSWWLGRFEGLDDQDVQEGALSNVPYNGEDDYT